MLDLLDDTPLRVSRLGASIFTCHVYVVLTVSVVPRIDLIEGERGIRSAPDSVPILDDAGKVGVWCLLRRPRYAVEASKPAP